MNTPRLTLRTCLLRPPNRSISLIELIHTVVALILIGAGLWRVSDAVRTGSVFRRCTRDTCRRRVDARGRDVSEVRGALFQMGFRRRPRTTGTNRKQRGGSGFATKAEAVEAMNRLQAAVADGTHIERSRRSLGEYLGDWLTACRNIRPNTARDYGVSIHKYITVHLGSVRLQSVDRLQIRGMYRKLAESGISEKTVHNIHICLHKALQDAVDDGLLRRNPADRAHAKPKDRPEMLSWSSDELATFLAFAAQDRDLALYHVAAATGMRRGELLGLRWRDVDLDTARLVVRQQFTRQGSGLGFGPPKSKKSVRTIDLDEETVALLREQEERQRFDRHASGSSYRTDLDLVFCRPGGLPEDPNVIGRRFERRVRALGSVPAITLHGLRHTHATLLLEAGVDVKTVSERLGHDTVQTTLELYGHVTAKMRSNAAARFGTLLKTARIPVAVIPVEN